MSSSKSFNLLHQWRIPSSTKLSQLPKVALSKKNGFTRCFCQVSQSVSVESGDKGSVNLVTKEKPLVKHEMIGAFQKLPMVMPSIDLLSSAQRKAKSVSPTKGIANIAKRERNRAAKQLDALTKLLVVPLREYMQGFPNKRSLHPYERSLIVLTFGEGNYEKVMGRVNGLRKKLLFVGKQHASLCAQSSSKREAEDRLSEGLKKVDEVFQLERSAIDDLIYVAKKLRAMPVVNPETPTLCLVGAPNVGKSSLVRVLSTGKPEICNYPFTTRRILMGHIIINFERFQVTDTPGLLTRHDDDRNDLERLTLAVLSHLPTAVLYVHDLTGECGTSPEDQFILYQELKEKFGDHIWLDVVSKCDLLQEPPTSSVGHDDVGRYKRFGPDGAIWVSVKSEVGINELKVRVQELLLSQMVKIRSEKSKQEGEKVA